MNKAGDFLSAILDIKTPGKAGEYSRLFSVWEQLTEKHGIAAAAHHSRIQDVRRGILIVDADHPGWIQILQIKEHMLLSELQKSFPNLDINGIAFRLSTSLPDPAETAHAFSPQEGQSGSGGSEPPEDAHNAPPGDKPLISEATSAGTRPAGGSGFEKIKDESLKEKLKSLERTIKQKNKRN